MSKRSSSEKNPTLNFFIRRFFRIAPLFYITVVLYFFLNKSDPRFYESVTNGNLLGLTLTTLTFTNSFNPYWINSIVPGGWSVAIEMLFYTLLPAIFLFICNLNRSLWLLLFSLVTAVISSFLFQKFCIIPEVGIKSTFLYVNFLSQLPVFAIGIVLFFALSKNNLEANLSTPLFLLLLLAYLAVTYGLLAEHILFAFVFSALAYYASFFSEKIIINRVTVFIGKISFSVYLLHHLVLIILERLGFVSYTGKQITDFGIRYVLTVLLSVLLSYVTYRFIEIPGMNLGKKLILYFEK